MKPKIDQTSALKRDEDPDVLAFREAMKQATIIGRKRLPLYIPAKKGSHKGHKAA